MAQEIGDISGIGKGTKKDLAKVGIETIDELARADPEVVKDSDAAISTSRMENFIKRAKESAVLIQTGDEVVDEYESRQKISTGVSELDEKLNGGIQQNHIVAVGGSTGAGKTQLAFQLCGQAVKQTGDPAVFIETEPDRYTGTRIQEMFSEEVQKKVHKIPVRGDDALDQQLSAYRAIQNKMDNVSLVVVDSFTARFRLTDQFDGRENLTSRSGVFSKHLTELEQLAIDKECPVILNCQIYKNPSQYGKNIVIYGSSVMMHIVNYVIKLKGKSGALTEFRCRNHPECGEFDMLLQINEDGIEYAD